MIKDFVSLGKRDRSILIRLLNDEIESKEYRKKQLNYSMAAYDSLKDQKWITVLIDLRERIKS